MNNFEKSLVTTSPSIVASEAKAEAIYQVLRVSIPEELHGVLASLDGAYGERQMYWQEQMYVLGYKEGRGNV
jgi:hypothetical protein